MDILKFVEDVKHLPNRFSNLDFWRSLKTFNEHLYDAFQYLDSWGNSIEKEQSTQNSSLTSHGQKITDLVAEQITQNGRLSVLEEGGESVVSRVSILEDGQKTLNAALEVVESDLSSQKTSIESLKTDVTSVTSAVETANVDISTIQKDQLNQDINIATNRDNIDAVNTNLNALIPLVYDGSVSKFKINTLTDSKAVITQLADGLYTVATTNTGLALATPPFYVTSRAAIYVYTNAEQTQWNLVNVPMAVIITMLSGKTDILWQPTAFYAPYGVKSLMGLYTTYITHI